MHARQQMPWWAFFTCLQGPSLVAHASSKSRLASMPLTRHAPFHHSPIPMHSCTSIIGLFEHCSPWFLQPMLLRSCWPSLRLPATVGGQHLFAFRLLIPDTLSMFVYYTHICKSRLGNNVVICKYMIPLSRFSYVPFFARGCVLAVSAESLHLDGLHPAASQSTTRRISPSDGDSGAWGSAHTSLTSNLSLARTSPVNDLTQRLCAYFFDQQSQLGTYLQGQRSDSVARHVFSDHQSELGAFFHGQRSNSELSTYFSDQQS
jgi:hypothetical protein